MTRKLTATVAALALAATLFTPTAEARDGRGHYNGGGHGGHYYRDYRGYHDDHGDAVAAGIIGLVLGVAIASAASQPPPPQARCYDNYRRCAPPGPPPGQGYNAPGGYDPRYNDPQYVDPRYDPDSAYEQDYGGADKPPGYDDQDLAGAPDQQQCTRRERQYDRYAQRYVTVDVPC